jgi:hypothetical protein
MSWFLDAGALVAIDRRDRRMGAMLRVAHRDKLVLRTTEPVLAQVWRDGRKQANLARVLTGIEVQELGFGEGKRVGELLGQAGRSDVVDAHLVLHVATDDHVLTSDPEDVTALLHARRVDATVTKI